MNDHDELPDSADEAGESSEVWGTPLSSLPAPEVPFDLDTSVAQGVEVLTALDARMQRIEQAILAVPYSGKHIFLITSNDGDRLNIHGVAHDADTARGMHSHFCTALVDWHGLLEARCPLGHMIEAWFVR